MSTVFIKRTTTWVGFWLLAVNNNHNINRCLMSLCRVALDGIWVRVGVHVETTAAATTLLTYCPSTA